MAVAGRGKITELAGAIGESGEHGITVGDGFVAREFEATGEGFDGEDGFGFHGKCQFNMGGNIGQRPATGDQRSGTRFRHAQTI